MSTNKQHSPPAGPVPADDAGRSWCARTDLDLLLRAMLTDDAYGAPFPTAHSGESSLSGPSNDDQCRFFLARVLSRHAKLQKNSNLPDENRYSKIQKVLLATADNDENNGYFPCTTSVVSSGTLGQLSTEEIKAALQLLKGRTREHIGRVRLDRQDKTLTKDRNGKVRKWIHKGLLWASLTGLCRQGDTEREFSDRVMESYDNIPAEDVKMFLNNRLVLKALSEVCTDNLDAPVTKEEVAKSSTSFLHNLHRSTIQVSTHEVEIFRTLQEEKKFSDVPSILSVESMRSRATQCVAVESIFRMLTYLREKQELPVVILAILWAVNKNIRHNLGVSFFDRFKSESFEGKVVVHPEVRAYWDDINRLHLSWNLSFCADERQTNLHWPPWTTHFKSTHSQYHLTSTIAASTGGGGGVPATDPPRPVPLSSRIKPPLPLIFSSHLQQLPCPDLLRGTHTHTHAICMYTHTRTSTYPCRYIYRVLVEWG